MARRKKQALIYPPDATRYKTYFEVKSSNGEEIPGTRRRDPVGKPVRADDETANDGLRRCDPPGFRTTTCWEYSIKLDAGVKAAEPKAADPKAADPKAVEPKAAKYKEDEVTAKPNKNAKGMAKKLFGRFRF